MIETDSRPGKPLPASCLPGVGLKAVLDLNDVADLLHAHPKTIRLMAQAGRIPGFRVGRLWRFSASRIHAWIDGGYEQAPA